MNNAFAYKLLSGETTGITWPTTPKVPNSINCILSLSNSQISDYQLYLPCKITIRPHDPCLIDTLQIPYFTSSLQLHQMLKNTMWAK